MNTTLRQYLKSIKIDSDEICKSIKDICLTIKRPNGAVVENPYCIEDILNTSEFGFRFFSPIDLLIKLAERADIADKHVSDIELNFISVDGRKTIVLKCTELGSYTDR